MNKIKKSKKTIFSISVIFCFSSLAFILEGEINPVVGEYNLKRINNKVRSD